MRKCKEKAQDFHVQHLECLERAVTVGKSVLLAVVRLSQEYLVLCQPVVPPLACEGASGNE